MKVILIIIMFLCIFNNVASQNIHYSKKWFDSIFSSPNLNGSKVMIDEIVNERTYYTRDTTISIYNFKGMQHYYFIDYKFLYKGEEVIINIGKKSIKLIGKFDAKSMDSKYSFDSNFVEVADKDVNDLFEEDETLDIKILLKEGKSKVKFVIYAKKEGFLQEYVAIPCEDYYFKYAVGIKNLGFCNLQLKDCESDVFITDLGYPMKKYEYIYMKDKFINKKILTGFIR